MFREQTALLRKQESESVCVTCSAHCGEIHGGAVAHSLAPQNLCQQACMSPGPVFSWLPQVTGAKGSSLLCLKGFPGTPLHRRVLKCGSQASSTSLPEGLRQCKFSGHSPTLFKQAPVDPIPSAGDALPSSDKGILEKIPLTHHISGPMLTHLVKWLVWTDNHLGLRTVRTLTNSGDSGCLWVLHWHLARREEKARDRLYTGPPELEPRSKGSLLTFKWLHQKRHEWTHTSF